jgi:hypothetical protein
MLLTLSSRLRSNEKKKESRFLAEAALNGMMNAIY